MSDSATDNQPHEQHQTPGERQAAQVLICCAIGFVCFLGAYMRIPVLPLLASGIGASTTQIGLINAAFMLSAGLLAVPSGLISDKVGITPVLLAGLALMSAASLLIPLSGNWVALGAIYLVFGVGLAAFTPTMMSSVARIVPRSHVGRAYSWYTTAVYLAMTIGPAAGGWFGQRLGFRQVFLVSGVLIAVALIAVLCFLPKDTHATHRTHGEGQHPPSSIFSNGRLMAALAGTLGGCFGFGMYLSFLPLHARAAGLSVDQIGIVFAAQALVNVLLRIPFGHLSDRIDRGAMSGIGLVVCAVALALTGASHTLAAMILGACLLGAGMGTSFTALSSLVAIVMPAGQRGLGMGLYNSCVYLGMMLSSATMGVVIKRTGFATGFLAAGCITFAATLLFLLLYRGSTSKEK
ncbi:membrane protein, major facilitator superfamily [Citrifermentans bemidjiense Bem]|uniref:Membrane protein, major facilitator superfamily n=1 Tax=Citrifermentans bemidjiense (strain ATCC BAA-1014 / DSM 16622 / JCM 12645 / Bem) TaxID=404380 RepID=B5E903_CITBB|nr:MFS transporter [Citrifermentans bemidjiense]ACH40167.1 membrane protein, major facilitator superfamily [Citrifermentans bemidjiense Bem]